MYKRQILRYFNVAGADKSKRSGLIARSSTNLIKVICEVATKKREKIIINGDDYETKVDKADTPLKLHIHARGNGKGKR